MRQFQLVSFVCASARRLLPLALMLSLLMALLPAAAAHAANPIEDQAFTTPTNATARIDGCCGEVAQTFTAGATGVLTAVSVDVTATALAGPLHISLHGVTDGLPNDTRLGQNYLWENYYTPIGSASITLLINIGAAYVEAGKQYAIVVDYDNSGPYGEQAGEWAGATGDHYPGGAAYVSPDNNFTSWTLAGAPDLDLHFRTFIDPTVPQTDISITRLSGATKAKACQIFSETYRVTNNGPDWAQNVVISAGGTDQFDVISTDRTPGRFSGGFSLNAGESRDIVVYIQVTAYVPGESRMGWISADVTNDLYPELSLDRDTTNNSVGTQIRMISKPVMTCFP
ncbi:MAG: hypothetical protein ACM3MF_01440 [Anaerolineae bacterium]